MDPVVVLLLSLIAILLLAASTGWDYTLERAWRFQRKRFHRRVKSERTRMRVRMGRSEHYEADLREIRDFVIGLHLATSLEEGLGGALDSTAKQLGARSLLGKRLRTHVEARLAIAPEEVIGALADDFQSTHLRDLVQRLDMAREGGISYDQALSVTTSLIEEEIRGDLRRDIQQAPISLNIPMIVGVFLPAIIIGVYPLIANILGGFR
jgi:hypothetical protein